MHKFKKMRWIINIRKRRWSIIINNKFLVGNYIQNKHKSIDFHIGCNLLEV